MTRTALVLALLAVAVAGAAAGYHFGSRQAPAAQGVPATLPAGSGDARAATARPGATAPASTLADTGDLAGERQRALDDPAYLDGLLQQYAGERQPDRK